jgi:Zn-dependent protease
MRYSYQLLRFHGVDIKIHIIYVLMIVITPVAFFLLFNILAALAILQFFLLLNLAVLLHEFVHVYVAKKYRVYFQEIILLPFGGLSIRKTQPADPFDETRIATYGLIVYSSIVILMIPIVYNFYRIDDLFRTHIYDFSPIITFFQIIFALMVFNAIPLFPLDGGRILRGYLTHKLDYERATKLVTMLSYVLVGVIILFGLIFDLVLVVLAMLLYAGAQGKGKFDEAVKVIEIKDKEAKTQELIKYRDSKKRLLKRTKKIRKRSEEILRSTRVGVIPRLWFKFRDYFQIELTKGKIKPVGERIISLLPFFLHVRELFKLWLKSKQVRKSIIFLVIASICLTLVWILPPGYMLILGVGFILSFGMGSFIIYYETRSRKLIILTGLGCLFWLIYLSLDIFQPHLKLDYWGYLYLEGIRGFMVPLTGIMFFGAIINSNKFFKKANAHMPVPAFVIIFTLFFIGTFILFYEIYMLTAYETDLDTIRFVLRYDIAYLIWFFASLSIFGSLIYLSYVGSISRYGRLTTFKITVGTVVVLFLLSFFTRDLIILMICRFSTPPEDIDLQVGLHSNNITDLDQSEFDNLYHLEVTWSRVYSDGSEPVLADWSRTDWQVNYAINNDIDIYFLINPYPPKWFVSQHPDSVMRDQWNNTFYWIDEDPSKAGGRRIWDLSFNDPEVIDAKLNFTMETLSRYQNFSCIKYVSIQNEPTYPVDFNHNRLASYDPVSEEAFRSWLRQSYDNDIMKFGNDTGINVKSWSDVDAPRATTDKLWSEWRVFREDSLINFVEKLTTAVKQGTEKPVTVKIMGHFLARYQMIQTGLSQRVIKKFIQFSDVASFDLYPLTVADLTHTLDYYKKLVGNKPIIISEFNMVLGSNFPGSGSMFYYNLIIINKYADAVIVFTGDNHYIYGINLYKHTPVHLGLKLFRLHREGGDVFSLYGELLWENLLSIPNYYELYIFACTVWNLPVIPWPVLLLIMMPVPVAEDNRRWRIKKYMYTIILIMLMLFFIASNLP